MQERKKGQDYFRLDINLSTIYRDLTSYLWVILSLALSLAMMAYIVSWVRYEPSYEIKATYVVTNKGINSNALATLDVAQTKAYRFTQILQSGTMKKKVANELDMNIDDVHIFASVIPETNLLTLQVIEDTPELAFRVQQSVMHNYPSVSQYLTGDSMLQVLVAPTVPAYPMNYPTGRKNAMKVGILAIFVFILIGTIISCMKDTIRTSKDIEQKLSTTALGEIIHENRKLFSNNKKKIAKKNKTDKRFGRKNRNEKESLLVTRPFISYWYVESVNTVTRAVQNQMARRGAKCLMVTSFLENEGKSTMAANLALTLAKQGKKVILVDLDLIRPAQYKIFDWIDNVPMAIDVVFSENGDFEKAIGQIPNTDVYTIFNNYRYNRVSKDILTNGRLEELIEYLKKDYDYIIMDTAPVSASGDTETIARFVDASLVVVRQHLVAAGNLNDMLDMLDVSESSLIGCVVNDVYHGNNRVSSRYGYGRYYGEYYSKKRSV